MKLQVLLVAQLMIVSTVLAQDSKMKLLGDFQEGWEKNWIERKFAGPPATFEMVKEDADSVLQVTTNRSGSALWHSLNIKPTERTKISWRWKVEDTLPDDTPERNKIGDDYVARVFLVFAPHLVNWRTRAICYVWAANEPTGTIYRSPYSRNVGIVVVQSGKENRGDWVTENRGIAKDYRKVFGRAPELLIAVAIMVDTDNTNNSALTFFDDIILDIPKPEKPKSKSRVRF